VASLARGYMECFKFLRAVSEHGFRVCVKTPCFGFAVLQKGTDLSVPKKGDNGARPLGLEGSGFSG
jgi:hypothetical protein